MESRKEIPLEVIDYYIGILPEDKDRFNMYISMLNSDFDHRLHVKIVSSFDDDYYTYHLQGTWDSYKLFLNADKWICSVTHYEDDK